MRPSALLALQDALQTEYDCHTALLYGSHARGDATANSDIDVMAFRDTGGEVHLNEPWQGLLLDVFIYPTEQPPDEGWLRLHDGYVLFQAADFGDRVLAAVAALDAQGPAPLSATEASTRQRWAQKMLQRATRGDAEGYYRRHWLLFTLLEDYFALRGQRYRGPKEALRQLAEQAPLQARQLEAALAPDASLATLRTAVEMTYSTTETPTPPGTGGVGV